MTSAVTDHVAAPTVELRGVSKRFRRGPEIVEAVADVSLSLPAGSVTALVGPSGSGKTTLLNLICGGETPDAGTVAAPDPVAGWARVAVVPQSLGLLAELSVLENVELPGRLGASVTREPRELIDALGLDDVADRIPDEVSLGQQQRTAIARACTVTPTLLIADEPTSHQDAANARLAVELLLDAAADGSTVVIATHDPRVVASCHRRVRLGGGRIG